MNGNHPELARNDLRYGVTYGFGQQLADRTLLIDSAGDKNRLRGDTSQLVEGSSERIEDLSEPPEECIEDKREPLEEQVEDIHEQTHI